MPTPRLAPFLLAAGLAGCVTLPREEPPLAALTGDAHPIGFDRTIRTGEFDNDASEATSRDAARLLSAAPDDGRIDILALSGGGAGGAFGAGAVVGLTQSGARPKFELVTGVSTGALIAPFAFLGPDWDDELTHAYTDGAGDGLTRAAGLGSLFRVGVLPGRSLRALVERYITQDLVDAVAVEAAKGRMLLAATTNLDSQELVIWDLGRIAMAGGDKARSLFLDVLVASASVPGVFPPVMIKVEGKGERYEEMHIDGGTSALFFIAPHAALVGGRAPEEMANANVYVLINGQLSAMPIATPVSTTSVALRGFSVLTSHMARIELVLTAALARRHDFKLHYASLPREFPYGGTFDVDRQAMRRVFGYAQFCARAGRLWTSTPEALDRIRTREPSAEGEPPPCPADPDLSGGAEAMPGPETPS